MTLDNTCFENCIKTFNFFCIIDRLFFFLRKKRAKVMISLYLIKPSGLTTAIALSNYKELN